MAEAAILATLSLLGEALASQLVKQATSQASGIVSIISDLESRMNNISSELRVMQAFIDEVDIHDAGNGTLRTWIGEVQNASHTIKGIVDEFMYMADNEKFRGMKFYLKKLLKGSTSFVALKQIASKLEAAEKSLKHLGEVKERWVPVTNVGINNQTKNANESSIHVALSAHFIDENEIVGFDDVTKKLTSLINFEETHLSIITVWGMPGVGKTTLVTNVYKKERNLFPCHAWICISQTYKVDQVLKNLIYEICKNDHIYPTNTNNMNMRELKETVRSLLQQKKYLIVLDDAWDQNSIQEIRDVFVEYHRGSRIIITSRMADVASIAKESNRLELKPLPDEASWNLFCKKAFPFEKNFECPPQINKWAIQIASKCGGLPLALVSLGSVLSSCAKTEYEWKRITDQLSWEMENNKSLDRLRSILKLSFNYLPKYLKSCFLYCCLFPEDCLIARKKLIRLWIAEGFVEQKGKCTLEETGESYLLELINHNMLQVARTNYSGRVKRCQMHDTLRELAISLCMKENFGMLYGENRLVIDKNVRRLSVISYDNIDLHVQLPLLQTLMSFDHSMHSSHLITVGLLKCRCLTVLNMEDSNIKSVPDNIGDLFNLRYLGMRNTKVKVLPNSISKLYNLQTLDLYNSEIQELPDGIVKLAQLRHLFAEVLIDSTYKSVKFCTGIKLPKNVSYFKEIQTIQTMESNAMVVRELGNLTQLRSLRIENVQEHHSAELCKSLSKMIFLSHLSISARNPNEILYLEGMELPNIQKLDLGGKLKESMLHSSLFQTSGDIIHDLLLRWSQLQDDPLPSLSHLKNLTFLNLNRAYEGQELIFKAGWFPKLKYLSLRQMPQLINVVIEEGTMVCLEEIIFRELKQLSEIPKGIEHLISLKLMFCSEMPAGFGGLPEGTSHLFHLTSTLQ